MAPRERERRRDEQHRFNVKEGKVYWGSGKLVTDRKISTQVLKDKKAEKAEKRARKKAEKEKQKAEQTVYNQKVERAEFPDKPVEKTVKIDGTELNIKAVSP